MGTEILKSFGTLQSELEQAKSSLKGVDEDIKRLIGRDPSELPAQRQNLKRQQQQQLIQQQKDERNNQRQTGGRRVFAHENDEPPAKRRGSVFNRLSDRVTDRPGHYEEDFDGGKHGRQMISKVIVTPKEVPSRQEALEAQSKDEKSKARNRRMFGALLGTLQKFQQEETKLKLKEEKRAQVEKKIEEIEIREKAEIKKEKRELFLNRKKKQAEIKMIELKMNRMKDYAHWEELQKPRMHFIMTKAKPHIHYMPRRMNDGKKALLAESKADIEKLIDTKRQEVFDELQQIEERMKRNFEPKKQPKDKDDNNSQEEDHENEQLLPKEEELQLQTSPKPPEITDTVPEIAQTQNGDKTEAENEDNQKIVEEEVKSTNGEEVVVEEELNNKKNSEEND